MPAYLITGFPGTGKTAVAHELKKRGYAAYDPEAMRGYMHLQDVQTGRPIHLPFHPPRGWFDDSAASNWDIPRVSRLLDEHETVFVCSLADNMDALSDRFQQIFVLTLDDFELEKRAKARGNPIDVSPEMLADTLTLHRHFEQSLKNQGALLIDAHPNSNIIVDRILENCRRNDLD